MKKFLPNVKLPAKEIQNHFAGDEIQKIIDKIKDEAHKNYQSKFLLWTDYMIRGFFKIRGLVTLDGTKVDVMVYNTEFYEGLNEIKHLGISSFKYELHDETYKEPELQISITIRERNEEKD